MPDVCALDTLVDGEFAVFKLGALQVGLVRTGEKVYAIHNRCPHMGAGFCGGRIQRELRTGGPSGFRSTDTLVLACPWHGWEFDVASGKAVVGDRYRVRTWPTEVRDGRVFVDPGRRT